MERTRKSLLYCCILKNLRPRWNKKTVSLPLQYQSTQNKSSTQQRTSNKVGQEVHSKWNSCWPITSRVPEVYDFCRKHEHFEGFGLTKPRRICQTQIGTPRTPQQYGTDVFKGALIWALIMPRDVSLSGRRCKIIQFGRSCKKSTVSALEVSLPRRAGKDYIGCLKFHALEIPKQQGVCGKAWHWEKPKGSNQNTN